MTQDFMKHALTCQFIQLKYKRKTMESLSYKNDYHFRATISTDWRTFSQQTLTREDVAYLVGISWGGGDSTTKG